ncbi:hypothetical protein [Deminuibacter soli]|nr:hypothetical protein [Deminuibacter soli]
MDTDLQSKQKDAVIGVLTKIETSTQKFTEDHAVATLLRLSLGTEDIVSNEALADVIAFSLYEESDYGIANWNCYFGPPVATYENGAIKEQILRELITSEMVGYWRGQASLFGNPVLRSRYLG